MGWVDPPTTEGGSNPSAMCSAAATTHIVLAVAVRPEGRTNPSTRSRGFRHCHYYSGSGEVAKRPGTVPVS
jgi:hypothetical protein